MSEAGALLQSVLGDFAPTAERARFHLEAALELEVDPLDYCAHRFGLGETLVMQRAAAWAGLEFFERIPQFGDAKPIIEQIDRFGDIRSLTYPLLDRRVVYSAPRFETIIRLKLLHEIRPELRRLIAFVPASSIRTELAQLGAEAMMQRARHRLWEKWRNAAGHLDAPLGARLRFALLLVLILVLVCSAPWISRPIFLPLVGALLLAPAVLRLVAALSPVRGLPEVALLDDADLPVYTVLVPLRDEAQMVGPLADALRELDYPPEKLDIHFVVEMQSHATVAAVQEELHDPRFQLLLVPDALPRTKPKALNYALPMVRGEHLVVFDAEDIPESGQLRLAASTFAMRPDLDCLQAELVIDNAGESWIAAWFAGEYAGQFGLMLPLLGRLGLPMPLGGTSNHFRVSSLLLVGGWDPFNVTEDADLGVRLARLGLKTATIESRTGEEAPIRLRGWLGQRSRWMKGWMQTLIVHDRDWHASLRDLGWVGFVGFHIYVGSIILSGPLHTAFAVSVAVALATAEWPIVISWWDVLAGTIFCVGYLGPVALVVAGLARLKRLDLLPIQALLPVYWMLHGVAVVRATWELVTRPHVWAKTTHGETRMKRGAARPAKAQAE